MEKGGLRIGVQQLVPVWVFDRIYDFNIQMNGVYCIFIFTAEIAKNAEKIDLVFAGAKEKQTA